MEKTFASLSVSFSLFLPPLISSPLNVAGLDPDQIESAFLSGCSCSDLDGQQTCLAKNFGQADVWSVRKARRDALGGKGEIKQRVADCRIALAHEASDGKLWFVVRGHKLCVSGYSSLYGYHDTSSKTCSSSLH